MPKKRINSKSKGNRGEREVVKILNEFYETDLFKRVPASGAFGTIYKGSLNASEKDVLVGDIITPEFFNYSIEVKNVKSVDLYKIFDTGITPWDEQLEAEKELLKNTRRKGPILVFKKTRRSWMAMICKSEFPKIKFYPRIELDNGKIIVPFKHLLNVTLKNLKK